MAKIIGMNENGKPAPAPKKPTLADSKPMVCESCDDDIFIPAMKFRKISKLLTGGTNDAIVPVEIYVCGNCGEINKELYPEELKQLEK